MKCFIIVVFSFSILTGCTYHPKERRLAQFKNNDSQILKSFYKIDKDTIHFKRILTNESELILQSGQIFNGEYGLTHQLIKDVKKLKNQSDIIDSLILSCNSEGLETKLGDEREVMFIQIIPDSAMSNFEYLGFLNLRHDIEDKIDERLKNKNLGEWFAGDMGAGGNMLFFINDWNNATNTVLELLKEESLLDHVLITKRIITAKDDWNYEIIYPVEYEGVFNQM